MSPLAEGEATTNLLNREKWTLASFVVFFLLASFTFWRVYEIRPLSGDNLYILTWASKASLSNVLAADPGIYPEWRPLAFFTVWLQYQWWGIDDVRPYFAVNLIIWSLCASLVLRIVVLLTGSTVAAFAAGSLLVVDHRSVTAQVWIVDRQMTMACLFGLLALLLALRRLDQPRTLAQKVTILGLLVAAPLSKEYGLAFAGALGLYALARRRRDLLTPAAAASVVYAALRVGVVEGAMGRYCEDMGFFFEERRVCYDDIGLPHVQQMIYTVAATVIGSILPGLFNQFGALATAPLRLAASVLTGVIGSVGWIRGSSQTSLMALVILCNAPLSVMLYRDRNHLAAICAFAVLVGVGLARLDDKGRTLPRGEMLRLVACALLMGFVGLQASRTRMLVSSEVNGLLRGDPCQQLGHMQILDLDSAKRIKLKYGMNDPDCSRSRELSLTEVP